MISGIRPCQPEEPERTVAVDPLAVAINGVSHAMGVYMLTAVALAGATELGRVTPDVRAAHDAAFQRMCVLAAHYSRDDREMDLITDAANAKVKEEYPLLAQAYDLFSREF